MKGLRLASVFVAAIVWMLMIACAANAQVIVRQAAPQNCPDGKCPLAGQPFATTNGVFFPQGGFAQAGGRFTQSSFQATAARTGRVGLFSRFRERRHAAGGCGCN